MSNSVFTDVASKENVVGIAFEPIQFLGLSQKFIEYAKKHTPEQKAHILLKQRERYALQTPEQKAKYNQSRKDKREKSNIAMMDALVAIN